MTKRLMVVLASAGLLTAGVAATATQTRSSPVAASKLAVGVGLRANEAARPDCALESNERLPECATRGRAGAVPGGSQAAAGGVSGAVLGALAAGAIGAAVAITAKHDSNG